VAKEKKAKKRVPEGAPAWMVTYSDIVTLLLTFFVMLLAQAELNAVEHIKIKEILKKIRLGFPNVTTELISPTQSNVSQIVKQFRSMSSSFGGGQADPREGIESTVREVEDGVEISMGGKSLFELGDWRLSDDGRELLDLLAPELIKLQMVIDVRGHTQADSRDSVVVSRDGERTRVARYDPENPDHTDRSDWNELGYLRAQAVANHLIGENWREYDISPQRIRISSHGKYDQTHPGTDPDTAHMNRRVSLYVTTRMD
jgi:chemotaxis protein MotB